MRKYKYCNFSLQTNLRAEYQKNRVLAATYSPRTKGPSTIGADGLNF